jgi:hypothetical protein
MSAQIDIISGRSELGQGSRLRLEEIAKASTATLDDRYRFAARSVNLTWPLCVRRSLRPITDESETKKEVNSLFAHLLLLASDGLGDLSRGNTGFLRFSARKFLEITPIDIQHKITVYKKVIIFEGRRAFVILACWLSDSWRYHGYCLSRILVHAELRTEVGLDAEFWHTFGEMRNQHPPVNAKS